MANFGSNGVVVPRTRLMLTAVSKPRRGRGATVWTHAGVVGAVALTLLAKNPAVTLISGGALITPLYLWLGVHESRRAPLIISPLSFYFVWYLVGFGLSPFYAAYLIHRDGFISFAVVNLFPDDIALAYVLCLAGSVALHIGIQCLRPLGDDRRAFTQNRQRMIEVLLAMGLVGIVVLLRPQWFQHLGTISRPLQAAPLTALVTFGLLGQKYFRLRRDSFVLLFSLGTAVLFAMNLRFGSKALLMFCLLPLLWLVLLRRHLHRWLPVVLVLTAAFYLVVIAPTVTSARLTSRSQSETTATHLLHSFTFAPANPVGTLFDQVGDFLGRQFDSSAVAFVVHEVDRNGYQSGETMRYAAYAFIPRFLWPDKPVLSRGAWFYAYVGGSPRESEATSSLGITAVGELYWNFGLGGVLAGMFTIGLAYGLLWRIAGSNPLTQPLYMLLYVLISIYGMVDMPEAVTVLAAIASNLLIFGALSLVFRRRGQNTVIVPRTIQVRRFVQMVGL